MTSLPRWFTDTDEGHSQAYVDQMRSLAAEGEDLAGEARRVDAMVRPRSRIRDAGGGPGRVGAALVARGHNGVGVDVDPDALRRRLRPGGGQPLSLVITRIGTGTDARAVVFVCRATR